MLADTEIKLLSGRASKYLMKEISEELGISCTKEKISAFKDGEILVQIKENIRGEDVFIVQSTHAPSDNLMELLLLIDAAKRASAARVTAVIPYFGYARQDRKDQPRVPISAKLVANLIERSGADRVLTVDLHADQLQGFFDIPVDNLYVSPIFQSYYKKLPKKENVVIAPDMGATPRARAIAKRLGNLNLAIVDKRRSVMDQSEVLHIIGEVEGMNCIIVDDIIDTGGTMTNAVKALKKEGAKEIHVACTHGLFADKAKKRFDEADIAEVVVTNTLDIPKDRAPKKLKVLSIAPLLAEAIRRIHNEESVSSLFA
jgi:ribose-phosphate pyrophosphokinase